MVIAPTGDRIDMVYYYMGEIFIRLGEFNHADISISTALYHNPNIARWWSRLGYAREMASDYTYALDAYRKALRLNATFRKRNGESSGSSKKWRMDEGGLSHTWMQTKPV